MQRYSDLSKCRPEPGSLLVESLELECTKNMHERDLVYFGQARNFKVSELDGWIADYFQKTRDPDCEVTLPHGKGFAISKQSLNSFQPI